MAILFAGLKARIIGSPTSTLGGALIGALNLLLHMAAANIDWTQARQMAVTGVGTVVPIIVGALLKATPKDNPLGQQLAQRIGNATTAAAEQMAVSVIDKAIAEVQKFGAPPVPEEQEEAKA